MRFFPKLVTFSVALLTTSLLLDTARASDVSVEINASKTSVQIAEPFEVEIIAHAPEGATLNFPTLGERLGSFDVLEQSDAFDIPDINNPKLRSWTRRITLETLETGRQQIPPLEVSVTGPTRNLVRTDMVDIQVASVLEDGVDPTSFRDIRDVVDVEPQASASFAWIGWAAASTLGLACLAGLAVAAVRRRRWMTPANWARTELKELQANAGSDTTTQSTIASTEQIIRLFIEKEFEFPATTFTPEQVVRELRQTGAAAETCERIRSLLDTAEKAKFAGLSLDDSEWITVQTNAESLIDELEPLNSETEKGDA